MKPEELSEQTAHVKKMKKEPSGLEMSQIKARHSWREEEIVFSTRHPVPDSAAEHSFLHISSSDTACTVKHC